MAIVLTPKEGGRQLARVITAAEQFLDTAPVNAGEGRLVMYGQVTIASASTLSLRINGSTANISQSFTLSGVATPTSGLVASSAMLATLLGAEVGFKVEIPRIATGRRRTLLVDVWKTDDTGVASAIATIAMTWNNTVDPISTLGVASSASGGLGIGSEIAAGPH